MGSDIKRYEPECKWIGSGDAIAILVEYDTGEYVLFSDHAAIVARLTALLEAAEKVPKTLIEIHQVRLERNTKGLWDDCADENRKTIADIQRLLAAYDSTKETP